MTDDELFVVAPIGSSTRWTVSRAQDPYGNGYGHEVHVTLHDDGIAACGRVPFRRAEPDARGAPWIA